jgi:hypothetical protein
MCDAFQITPHLLKLGSCGKRGADVRPRFPSARMGALMKYATDRPCADPEKAARRLMEHAQAFEPIQEGRIYIEKINGPFLFGDKGHAAEYSAGLELAISRAAGWSCPFYATRGARREGNCLAPLVLLSTSLLYIRASAVREQGPAPSPVPRL